MLMPSDEIQKVMNRINATIGKNVLQTIDAVMEEKLSIKKIPTGSLKLDRALGGGVPRGGAVEFYGGEGSGKTTMCYNIIAQCQKMGLPACYGNLENRFNPQWAETQGVNLDELILYNPFSKPGEDVLEDFKAIIRAESLGLLIIDSLPGLVPSLRLKKSFDEKTYSGFSGILSTFSEVMMGSGYLRNSGTCLIGINQLRDKVGVIYGDPTRTPGGRAWKHLCWQRVSFTKGKYIKQGDNQDPIGQELEFFVRKNQLGIEGISGGIEVYAEAGINVFADVYDMAVYYGFITKRGKWNYYMDPDSGELYNNPMTDEEYKWDGAEKTKQAIVEDPFLFEDLLEKVKDRNSRIGERRNKVDE
jgi:recombination protein RecA